MRCPGQDSRYWKPEAIFEAPCPVCAGPVEFFKDESTRRCRKCGHRMVNPRMDFGCAAYCKFAEQCLGELTPELLARKNELLKDRVAIEMKRRFQQDFRRIGHATKTARYAEQIGREEKGDLAIILAAAYLHEVGAPDKDAAREILDRLGAVRELTDEVCAILAPGGRPDAEATVNFKAFHDTDWIAHAEESRTEGGAVPEELAARIENELMTASGRKLAKSLFAKS